MSTRGDLYKLARLMGDIQAYKKTVQTGDDKYIDRRIKNRIVGRALGPVWRQLWK